MFDETAVLDAATHEFRAHGFADTSTEPLFEASGVGRSTLYNTFTSKEEFLVRALASAARHGGPEYVQGRLQSSTLSSDRARCASDDASEGSVESGF
ncbi:TetR/AcrR family transcriptional regulator [Arachnia propionica]|uniref:TetR/AcrR family transcriptional regulator n=1 Tax=Arachnia propionica TaxID=1750 RepID=A0A3P1TFP0_9ACTN|nr:TetR/AcrR family transcriptional regulator [Arachnia propionica]